MTIRHMQIFIAVAKYNNMSVAAKKLYISQPTVSQVIAEIEENYGIKLFERLAKKLYITDAGKQLLGYARSMVALFDEMQHSMNDAAEQKTIKVGATITVGSCVLTEIVNRVEAKQPRMGVQVVIDNTAVIEHMILNSELDVAVVEGTIKSKDIIVKPAINDELVLVCGINHPFNGKDMLLLKDLDGQPFVLREKGSGTREQFEKCLESAGINIYTKWSCHSSDAVLSAVMGGQGLTVISKLLVDELVHQGKLHIIHLEDARFDRTFNLIYHKNKFLSQAINCFIDEVIHN
ncbi:DNA-binding transcriptional LysR family regulator [Hydrogenoanaerobacterium saccharovorans]|uniref:DNA-binding transcriptional regulator, LysR family n=1 Tax=Hydrogenoanaerobacterium saccharovorans TaxID=474960 RepID=A0A1H8BIB2_9FIRM|nr:LysR family transcriptional regulator [Hydrogenoanaerobacterium saccharovorans]RPF47427.1 DNA-binding transcriptional LysR family regulator [Hydrogenoanaerobacterium saccharovorans]SEM81748.1 DNA-binding transcriptional regulator, LysR family [Hydrogenoanaerobacterium saccharovorans]